MKFDRNKYFNLKQLKERGWTNTKINLWLKEPDKLIKNPIYRSASPSKLYLSSKVKQQEKNKRFLTWIEASKGKREKLSNSLKETNSKKRKALVMYITSLDVKIKKYSIDKLTKRAVRHYNDLWFSRGDYDKHATVHDDREFLNRICLNMLRHEQEHYEYEICQMFGKVGKDDGYAALREKIETEILKVYPFLA